VQASGASIAAVEARIDRWLALGIPMIVVLAAALGWWLTGRTLRPVGRMADASARIEPGTGGRLPIDDPDDELGRLGTRFNALLDRLDGALDQQRRFIGDAAHELRTPLARLRSRVDVALRRADVLPAVERDIVRMLLWWMSCCSWPGVDAGRDQPLRVHAGHLPRRSGHRRVATHWQKRRATPGQLTCVVGTPLTAIRPAGPAHRHSADKHCGTAPAVLRDVRVSTERGLVTLDVEDNGIGMSDEERSRVFERFYRGERARARRSDGSGLGLAIAKWIAEAHRGTIRVSPGARSEGTLVTVQLPERPPA
jgi:signal transduction histidine kinase